MIPPETVNMHLFSPQFEQAFALVEGSYHLVRSLSGMMGEESIIFVRSEFLKFVHSEPNVQERLIALAGPDARCGLHIIYGDGGWNRYSVTVTGEVIFLHGPGKTKDQTEYAKSVGFRVI